MDRCPRHDLCAHPDKLAVRADGSCLDCGTQIHRPSPDYRARPRRPRWPAYVRETTADLWDELVK
jgi:hypothetical protein